MFFLLSNGMGPVQGALLLSFYFSWISVYNGNCSVLYAVFAAVNSVTMAPTPPFCFLYVLSHSRLLIVHNCFQLKGEKTFSTSFLTLSLTTL